MKFIVLKFIVWCPEMGGTAEYGKCIDAFCPEAAARIWAHEEDSQSADDWIVGGGGKTVIVRDEYGKDQELFVYGEQEVTYYARKK